MIAISMKNPVHPGRVVQHDCLEPLGLSVTAGAKILGVSRQTLNKIGTAPRGRGRAPERGPDHALPGIYHNSVIGGERQ